MRARICLSLIFVDAEKKHNLTLYLNKRMCLFVCLFFTVFCGFVRFSNEIQHNVIENDSHFFRLIVSAFVIFPYSSHCSIKLLFYNRKCISVYMSMILPHHSFSFTQNHAMDSEPKNYRLIGKSRSFVFL